jgi:uncharacterized protein (UPF0262 family)
VTARGKTAQESSFRIVAVTLDEGTLLKRGPEIEQEKKIAIHDLLEANQFTPKGSTGGPYRLVLAIAESRLVFDIRLADDAEHGRVVLALAPFVRVLKGYREVCESYYAAIREAPAARIEAIDMGRRGLHDEGAALLMERLEGKIAMDLMTARQLFTLICALSLKGA